MTRRLFLGLPLAPQIETCEWQAVEKWNRLVLTSERYLALRKQGIRNLKERQRMEREFSEVIKDQCF